MQPAPAARRPSRPRRRSHPRGLRVDLVPAYRDSLGRLFIAEHSTSQWIPIFPVDTAARLDAARAKTPDVDVAVRLLKGWRRARGRNAPIGSFALETAVVNRVIGARRIPALDELVFGFFDCPADHDKRRRLVLSGQATDAPVTLIDPASGNNLTEGLDHDGKKALIDAACRARGELTRIQSLAEEKPGPAMTALRKLFVG